MCIHNENIDILNLSIAIHNWNKHIHNWNTNFHNWILDVHNWIMDTYNWIIKSHGIPGVILCFCAGLYALLPSPPPPPTTTTQTHTFVNAITSDQLFGFLSFFTCRLDYFIRFWSIFVSTLNLNWIFKVKYGICYNAATNGLIATERKANLLFVL